MVMLFIAQGYYSMTDGFVTSEKGSMLAIQRVDENDNPIGTASVALSLDDIPRAIRELFADDTVNIRGF